MQFIYRSVFLLVFTCFGCLVGAQHSDCQNALNLEDTVHVEKKVSGAGHSLEIAGNEPGNQFYFTEEHNTVWYRLTAPASGKLTFDLIPLNGNDDWDFILFKVNGEASCNEIKSKMIKPVRTNISRNNLGISGRTGLSATASKKFVPAGPGDDYSRSLNVEKGEQFILVTDNVDAGGEGHKLILHWPRPEPGKKKSEKPAVPSDTIVSLYKLEVYDKQSREPVKAKFQINGISPDQTLTVSGKSKYEFLAGKYKKISITVNAKGYLFENWSDRTGGSPDTVLHVFRLNKVESGSRLKLEKVYFKGNEATLLPGSKETLEALLSFMQENPGLEIEIEGHVNGPHSRNTRGYKMLSQERADAVKAYLVKNGIEESRMTTEGYGNKHMVYPDPKTDAQSAANRRVEVLVK